MRERRGSGGASSNGDEGWSSVDCFLEAIDVFFSGVGCWAHTICGNVNAFACCIIDGDSSGGDEGCSSVDSRLLGGLGRLSIDVKCLRSIVDAVLSPLSCVAIVCVLDSSHVLLSNFDIMEFIESCCARPLATFSWPKSRFRFGFQFGLLVTEALDGLRLRACRCVNCSFGG